MIDFGLMDKSASEIGLPAASAGLPAGSAAGLSPIDFGLMTSLPAETSVQTVVHTEAQTVVHTEAQTEAPVTSITFNQSISTVQQTVTATPKAASRASLGAAFVAKPEHQWGWDDLRDYVLAEIEKRHGPQPRDSRKEAGIFKAFMTRYPDGRSIAIARAAFEIHDGMWRSAPISVNRFCVGSDPFFGNVIAERI